ncbi:MAG: helix-turn-helix domain-containing protein [Bacteroidales bacterium]|jgi:excisionase family DNA binding protein|nr:helix-turn-helix domain-containing protein [Bacteroidales bacterium]
MKGSVETQKRCEWCNQLFIAQKMTTRYCSHACNSRAYKAQKKKEAKEQYEVERKTQYNMVGINYATMKTTEEASDRYESIKDKEYLSVSETAFLLSVGRATIYRYLHSGLLKAVQTNGKTFIRKTDIDSMFDNTEEYRARPTKDRKPITEFYTVMEIKEKYNVKESWIFNLVKANKIPKTLVRGKSYISKKHIDQYFDKKGYNATKNITEWYSVEDIQEKYALSIAAIYCFVSNNCIPKKRDGRNVLYSKIHFDKAKSREEPKYYTVEEAMRKYKLTRDALYYQVKFHHIAKVKVGKYIKISKPELDKLFETLIVV